MGIPHTQLKLVPTGVMHTSIGVPHTWTLPHTAKIKKIELNTDKDGNHHITLHEE